LVIDQPGKRLGVLNGFDIDLAADQTGLTNRCRDALTNASPALEAGARLSRRGNHRLKNAMFLTAFASLRVPESKAFHDRKRAQGERHNAARICLARRRCNVILAMLRTGEASDPSHPVTPAGAQAA
jgi:hypothetical protein